jgi:hypothetical protein
VVGDELAAPEHTTTAASGHKGLPIPGADPGDARCAGPAAKTT